MHFVGIHISSLIGCSDRSISPLFAAGEGAVGRSASGPLLAGPVGPVGMEMERSLPLTKQDFAFLCEMLQERHGVELEAFVATSFTWELPESHKYEAAHFCGVFFAARQRLPPGFAGGRWLQDGAGSHNFLAYGVDEVPRLLWERRSNEGWSCRGLSSEEDQNPGPIFASAKFIAEQEDKFGFAGLDERVGSDAGGSTSDVGGDSAYSAAFDEGFAAGLAAGIEKGQVSCSNRGLRAWLQAGTQLCCRPAPTARWGGSSSCSLGRFGFSR